MTPFYQRSLEERLALTAAAIREKRTLIERWTALEAAEARPWSRRAAFAAEYLRDQPAVADFGCGTMTLAALLQPHQRYIPLDLVARDPRTLICDLNLQPPPETGATAAAFLGLVEYLHDPLSVLQRLSRQYRVLVVSYCTTDSPKAPPNRREHAWVNDFSDAEMQTLFRQSGWIVDAERRIDNMQKIWRLVSAAPAEIAASPA